MEETKEKSKSKSKLIDTALVRFKLAEEASAKNRSEALEDIKFSAGEQWPQDIKQQREREFRPCLTINRLPQFIRQITNDQRQNRPSIKVLPVDDQADIETAKIFQGMIRHIELSSKSDVAYDTAFDGAVRKGFGYFRVVTDFVDPLSFEQEIRIKAIRNSFSVFLDPFHKEPDGSDAEWGFIFEDIPHDEFKRLYGESELCKMSDWDSLGNRIPNWFQDKSVRVAEYFYKDYEDEEIFLLSNGETISEDSLPDILPDGISIVDSRVASVPVVRWAKINGIEILEETTFPGSYIPIIPVYGEMIDIEGEIVLEGAVRHARDPQRMYNFWATAETEMIALAPKAPWIGYAGQFDGFEHKWQTSNSQSHAYLEVNPVDVNGDRAPLPQRNAYEPPVQAITSARFQSAEDLKATTGIYDAALGNRSNETSGIAIQSRTAQAQTSNYHFIDNLTRSIRHCGRIIVDIVPVIYDTARAVRILSEDGSQEIVRINQIFNHNGKEVNYQLGVGKYDVVVETGPSFATRRQEAAASMVDFMKAVPTQASVVVDLIAKNMDWPGSSEFAERLRKTIPPNLIDDKNQQQIPPQVQAQLQQMSQVVDQLTAQLNQATEEIRTKKMELESKERIELAKLETSMRIELLKANAPAAQLILEKELAEIDQRQQILGFDQSIQPNFNGAGPQGAVMPPNQQPTGGYSPGNYMGEMP